jgi:hypothetical protein
VAAVGGGGFGGGAVYVPLASTIFSTEAVAKMAVRWSAVKAKPLATMVSCPGPPAIWKAVPISCTVNVVPLALVLPTVKPLTELCDRSSVASEVTSCSFAPLP